MDVFEALYTTRAMRRVSEDPIPEDILKQMVDAGIRAPSGSNRQGWKFIVVTDQEIKNQLGDSYREAWDFYVKEFYGGSADMGASNVPNDEKAEQVVRIVSQLHGCLKIFIKYQLCLLCSQEMIQQDPRFILLFGALCLQVEHMELAHV